MFFSANLLTNQLRQLYCKPLYQHTGTGMPRSIAAAPQGGLAISRKTSDKSRKRTVFFLSLNDMVYLAKKENIPGGKKWITTLVFSHYHTWCCSWELLNSSGTWKWCWSSASLSCFHHCQTGHSRNLRPAWCVCWHQRPQLAGVCHILQSSSEMKRLFYENKPPSYRCLIHWGKDSTNQEHFKLKGIKKKKNYNKLLKM